MTKELVLRAPAKINLGLTVIGSRADGYHNIETVMQQISLSDILSFRLQPEQKITFVCTDSRLSGDDNLIWQAATLLSRKAHTTVPGIKITLFKNIPVAAGLAGGSSDAAAALIGLNEIWQIGLNLNALQEIAAEIGSDVPYCLKGGTALARGRGEILEQLPPLPFFWVVLAIPSSLEISTAKAYRSFDRALLGQPSLKSLIMAVRSADQEGLLEWTARSFCNTLETAQLPELESVKNLKNALLKRGFHPVFSGSGPTLFMLFKERAMAQAALQAAADEGAQSLICWTESNSRRQQNV